MITPTLLLISLGILLGVLNCTVALRTQKVPVLRNSQEQHPRSRG